MAESGEAVLLGFEIVPDVVDWVQLPFDADALLDFCVLGDSIDAPVQRPVCIKQSSGYVEAYFRVTRQTGWASAILAAVVGTLAKATHFFDPLEPRFVFGSLIDLPKLVRDVELVVLLGTEFAHNRDGDVRIETFSHLSLDVFRVQRNLIVVLTTIFQRG